MPSPLDYQTARSNMLHSQLLARGIASQPVLDAMDRIPRERFVAPGAEEQAYADRALPIDCGQTISQPYIVALMTEALELTGHERVLEIGTGSGYQAAVLSELAREVVSVERHADLAHSAAVRLAALGCRNVTVVVGDGSLGWPELAPYDRIIVTAASRNCPPDLEVELIDGGLLVIPLGDGQNQNLVQMRKTGDRWQTASLSLCRFVPLIGQQAWPS
jgi:protein-L-isoaspartate(D-aspartate) O-methyltransferase